MIFFKADLARSVSCPTSGLLPPLLLDVAAEIPVRSAFWIDTHDALRARAEYAASNGVTELLYAPVGPSAADELRRMAALLSD